MTHRDRAVAAVAVFVAVLFGVTSTVVAPHSVAATVLVVPGTGTPDPSQVTDFMANAVNYYAKLNAPSCQSVCTPAPIKYPASLWPLIGPDQWDVSVAKGVSDLTSNVVNNVTTNPSGQIVVFGFSQGSSVASQEKSLLANVANKGQYYFVLVGNPQRPNGGLINRLAGLGTVPIVNVTFGLPTPTDTGIATTDIAYQYDGVADFPKYPINLLADLNALAGVIYVHQFELAPNGKQPKPLPYGYTYDSVTGTGTLIDAQNNPDNQQHFGDTTYITLPATSLPLLAPLQALGATPLVDLIQPALQVLIETGYDRTNYGDPSPAALIPPVNPVKLVTDLVAAVDLGVHNAVSNFGNTTPVPLAPSWGPGQSTATTDTATAASTSTTSIAVAAPTRPTDQLGQARTKRKQAVSPAAPEAAAASANRAAAASGSESHKAGTHARHREAS